MYDSRDYYHMFWAMAQCNGNPGRARLRYAELCRNKPVPCCNTFRRTMSRAFSTGSLLTKGNELGRTPRARRPAVRRAVLRMVRRDPTASVRDISRRLNVSRMTVHRILKGRGLHPFKFVRVQKLHPQDYVQRVNYSTWLLGEVHRDPAFCSKVLWTDEALFTREGCFNAHNAHVWAAANPVALRNRAAQERWSVNLWAGVIGDFIVGPYVLPRRLDGPAYKEFLEHVLPQLLENIPLEVRGNMFYQHDGAPAHYAANVRAHLDTAFRDRWIGRRGPVPWPPRSPDMNPLDFFLWGYLKNEVYRQPVDSADELMARVNAAVAKVTVEQLRRVQGSIVRRAELCLDNQGGHVEPYL